MSKQAVLWAIIVLPWLTLLFMKKEDVKRFMPVALFTFVTSVLIGEVGFTFKLWGVRETAYPFYTFLPSVIGVFPVLTMWIFKYTYGRFWTYLATNVVLDIGWVYAIFPWFVSIGVLEFLNAKNIIYLFTVGVAVLLYVYQMWQEDALVSFVKRAFSPSPQPAAKPSNRDKDDPGDSE